MKIQLFIILFIFSVLNSCGQEIEVSTPLFPCSKKLNNPYGVTSHFDSPGRDYDTQLGQLELMSDCRIGNARMDMPMKISGNNIPVKSYLYLDTALNRNQEYRIENLVIVPLAISSSSYAWDNLNSYSKAFDFYLNRFASQVKTWEIINEVNLKKSTNKDSLPYKYMSILPLTYNIIKKRNKNNIVLMSGIAGKDMYDFARKLYEQKAYNYFDVFNFHTYSKPENIAKELKTFASLMTEYGKRHPVWITECGMTTYSDKTQKSEIHLEVEQSKRLSRIFIISFSYGVDKVYWYEFCSNPKNKGTEREFGIVSAELNPKPAYFAYKTMTRMCPSGSLRPKLYILGSLYLAEWKRPDKKKVWAVWDAKGVSRKQDIEIIGKARYFDYLGREIDNINEINDGVTYIVGAKSVRLASSFY